MSSNLTLPQKLTTSDLSAAAKRNLSLEADHNTYSSLDTNHRYLINRINSGEQVYGINTGFGPLVDHHLSAGEAVDLQENLLQQLNCHTGRYLSAEVSRAVVTLRARALSEGVSGVRSDVLKSLIAWQHSDIQPALQTQGSVGASGDLVPLSRIARVISGRDEIVDADGNIRANSEDILADHNLPLWNPAPKEALALVNGTSYSSALATLGLEQLKEWLHDHLLPQAATFMTVLEEPVQHLSSHIYRYKNHTTAIQTAENLRNWLNADAPETENGVNQPPYSSRSMVLWLGAVQELIDQAENLLETEINSVDDNPLILDDEELFLHGANFQGSYTAIASDHLANALTRMVLITERYINRLLHPNHNGNLPAFLSGNPIGKKSGLQGYQLMASSILADLRTRTVPHGVQSIPTNGDNQDVVSMSANAALNLVDMIDRATPALAVFPLILSRAMQLSDSELTPQLNDWWQQYDEIIRADYEKDQLRELLNNHMARIRRFTFYAT